MFTKLYVFHWYLLKCSCYVRLNLVKQHWTCCAAVMSGSGRVCHSSTSSVVLKQCCHLFSEKHHIGILQAITDNIACKCAIMKSMIFSSECTRNHLSSSFDWSHWGAHSTLPGFLAGSGGWNPLGQRRDTKGRDGQGQRKEEGSIAALVIPTSRQLATVPF